MRTLISLLFVLIAFRCQGQNLDTAYLQHMKEARTETEWLACENAFDQNDTLTFLSGDLYDPHCFGSINLMCKGWKIKEVEWLWDACDEPYGGLADVTYTGKIHHEKSGAYYLSLYQGFLLWRKFRIIESHQDLMTVVREKGKGF